MSKNFYNRIASNYDIDWSDIYRDTRTMSVHQIVEHYNGRPVESALDLAVGTGNSFFDLDQCMHIKQRTGNDISSEMLKQAKSKITGPIEFVCEDARNIGTIIPPHSQDLILCHYLFSYLDMDEILNTAFTLLKPGGVLSMVTTTKRNLLELSTGRFHLTGKLFRVGKHLSLVETPSDHDHCLKILTEHAFEIIAHSKYNKKVYFQSFTDVKAWSIDSGWAAQYFDRGFRLKALLGRSIFAGAALLMHPLYPIAAHSDISVVLAQKPAK